MQAAAQPTFPPRAPGGHGEAARGHRASGLPALVPAWPPTGRG
jgi:hypothetical protein